MLTSIRAAFAISFVVLPGVGFAQVKADELIKTTLCDLVKQPERFNGKMVQVRAEFVSNFEWTGLSVDSCSAKLRMDAYHVLDDLKPKNGQYAFVTTDDDVERPDLLKWQSIELPRPVQLREDISYRTFREYAGKKYKWVDGSLCLDCPLYRINLNVTGRFDYFPTQAVAVRTDPSRKPFIHSAGDANAPLLRLNLQSVTDIAAVPIDPSVYSQVKRRDISLAEANSLIYAFLNSSGCTDRSCGLDEYTNSYFPQFYFFEATWDNPNGSPIIGHYAVDPRTGDVWDAIVCGRLTSPALIKLQKAVRKQIALTEEKYRRARRPGPMCGPGEKPVVIRPK